MNTVAPNGANGEPEEEEANFSPREMLAFAVDATRRHVWLASLVGAFVLAVGLAVAVSIPQNYDATTKIFIRDSVGVTSALTSGRTMAQQLDGARALNEFILARDNLVAIVREARLFETWPRTRALPMRIKDSVMAALVGSPSQADMERVFVEMLALSIFAKKDGESVRINGQWRDPHNAYDITRLVQRNFLAARAAYELGPVLRAVPLLEAELAAADREVEDAIERLLASRETAAAAPPPNARPVPGVSTQPAGGGARGGELISAARELSEVRAKLKELTGPSKERVAALKLELVELQASYSADHPRVLQQQAKIAAASAVSSDMAALRLRENELLGIVARSAPRDNPLALADPSSAAAKPDDASATVSLAPFQSRLGQTMKRVEELRNRLETARLEIATVEMDFQHRYVVVEQPEVPGKPVKSKRPLFLAGAVLAGLLAAILTAVLRELRRDYLRDPWQVRSLGPQLIGDVELPRLPSGKGED